MILKCIATSSSGNAFVLTSDTGKHLMIEAGLPLDQLKQGIDFDIANWEGLICSHGHTDHSLSVEKIRKMGITTYTPYMDTEHKRLKTQIGDFKIESFPVPHNGCENRGFIIRVDDQTIMFLIDLEYMPYDVSSIPIDTLIVECNYIEDLVDGNLPNIQHKCMGHSSLESTIKIIKNCQKHLRRVYLTHASKGVTMDKDRAIKRIYEEIPNYIQVEFLKDNVTKDISLCPF